MNVRIYLAPLITDTEYTGPPPPWPPGTRGSLLYNYVDIFSGEYLKQYLSSPRAYSIAFCVASDATHANIIADTRIVALSQLVELEELTEHLDALFDTLPDDLKIAARNKLEESGINTAFVDPTNTLRDVIRAALRTIRIMQRAEGLRLSNVIEFLKNNLDTKASNVPQAQRNAVVNWMQSQGLATGWITGTTLVREVVHFIVSNLGLGVIKISTQRF